MKKILTCALAFALCFSMCLGVMAEAYGTGKTRTVMPISEDVPESAEQNEENRLKAVLTAVKTAVDIPEEYTEFDYDLYTRYEEETWNLMWRNEDYTKTISVNADSEGKITLYNNTIHNMPIKAPLIRRSEALETAYKFIDRVYPGITDSLKEEEIYGTYFGSGTYQFNFVREENGITYAGDNVNISVDYTDGTVRSMYINWDPELEFASPEGVIAPNAAQKIWKNDSEMQLKYRIFNIYDADGNIESAEGKLIYLNAESQKNINAFDGEYYVKDYSWADKNTSSDMIFGVTNESASAAPEEAENGSVKFNENELKKMEELASYVTIENADRNLRSYKQFAIDDTYTLSSYSTGYFYRPYTVQEDRPIVWNLVYTAPVKEGEFYTTTARATVDAQSGEVLSFSTYIEYPWFDGEGNCRRTFREASAGKI